MATNNILPFCPTDTGTNLLTQGQYAAAADRTNGNQPGVASSKLNNKALRQAAFMASQLAQFMADKTGSNVLDDGDTAALLAIFNAAFADPLESYKVQNLGIAAAVASNALTIDLKDSAGAAPSATSPVKIGFRSPTSATGTYNTRSITGALSLTVSSGSTLGMTSAIPGYLYVYGIDTGSGVVLGISSTRFDDGSIVSTTAEGGAGGADSATVMYSAAAQTNKPCRLIGRILCTQATAGTWATAMTEISLLPFVVNATGSYRAVSTADSAVTSDGTVSFSGTSFSFALYTAVGNKGAKITLTHQGTSLSQVYTLTTAASQTIGGIASGSYKLVTNGESLTLQSDGANWIVIDHKTDTGWITSTLVLTGSTTNPTKATSHSDFFRWKRVGDTAFFQAGYYAASPTGAADGSGSYQINLPSGMVADITEVSPTTATAGMNAYSKVGELDLTLDGATQAILWAYAWSTTKVVSWFPGTGGWGGGLLPLSGTGLGMGARFSMKIVDWQP